jgi:hypothetical protein
MAAATVVAPAGPLQIKEVAGTGSERPPLVAISATMSTHRGQGVVSIEADPSPRRSLARAARPAVLVAGFYGAVVIALLATHGWDPRLFATVGPQWERHDPGLRKQADGSIFLEFAVDPVDAAARHPRLRTARILYPLLARGIALGHRELAGWGLVAVNLAAIVVGTEMLHRLLEWRGLSPWAALAYGAWGGLGLALLHDTAEPLAYACALAGVAAQERRRPVLSIMAFLGALLARETALGFVAPYLLASRDDRDATRWLAPLTVLSAWGAWLAVVFLAGTGPWAPSYVWPRPPLVGYLATRPLDRPATVLYLVAPALVVTGWAIRELRRRPGDASLWAAALNALLVLSLPSRTAELLWHSGRLAVGFVAAVLLSAPLAASSPGLWRALAVLFASSASWTAAVTLRYLLWDAPPW